MASPAVCLMRCGITEAEGEREREEGTRTALTRCGFRGENYNWQSWLVGRGKRETIEQLDRNAQRQGSAKWDSLQLVNGNYSALAQ